MTIDTYLPQPPRRFIGLCALPLAVNSLLDYLGTAPFGSQVFVWLTIWGFVLVVPALFACALAPLLLFFRRTRLFGIRAVIGSIVIIVAVYAGILLGERVRMLAFHGLAERSAPLVRAIRAYEVRHGTPPTDLAALVPGFLPAIPGTGMAAYPSYRYYAGERAANYEGNPWVLSVFTPRGTNFDEFNYFPLQNYPNSEQPSRVEQISDWVYFYE